MLTKGRYDDYVSSLLAFLNELNDCLIDWCKISIVTTLSVVSCYRLSDLRRLLIPECAVSNGIFTRHFTRCSSSPLVILLLQQFLLLMVMAKLTEQLSPTSPYAPRVL